MRKVTVYRSYLEPHESWAVEMNDPADDGVCEKAIFYGSESERQAREYAQREYAECSRSTKPERQRV
jgi:hypothetical protein